tara:strand:- start:309 stop:1811 length:1503 start_codon:yes stop_codon:yes gene_type:complete
MNTILFGSLSILSASLIFILAFRCFNKLEVNKALFLLIIGGLILRIFCSCDFYLHAWDERFHALVAKNLIQDPLKPTLYQIPILEYDYRHWWGNHIWVHKQPLPLWTLAGSLYLFGINEFALRLPSILLSSIAILLVFPIAKHYFNSRTGFLAAFLMAINGLIIEIAAGRVATDHIDVFFMFFILLSVFFCLKLVKSGKIIYSIFIGFSVGLAILSKWLPAIIVFPICLLMLIESSDFSKRKIIWSFIIMLAVGFLVMIPWQWFIYQNYPLEAQWEASFNWKHFSTVLDNREGSSFYFLNQIRINYGELIYLPLVWFIYKSIKLKGSIKYWVFLIWTTVPLIIFSLAKTKMQAYILFTAPAYFIMSSAFFDFLLRNSQLNNKSWKVIAIWLLFLILPIRYSIERIKPFDTKNKKPQWVLDLKALNIETDRKSVLFNYPKPIEAMFYTDLTVYEKLPSISFLEELKGKSYKIYIYDPGNLEIQFGQLKGIEILNSQLAISK